MGTAASQLGLIQAQQRITGIGKELKLTNRHILNLANLLRIQMWSPKCLQAEAHHCSINVLHLWFPFQILRFWFHVKITWLDKLVCSSLPWFPVHLAPCLLSPHGERLPPETASLLLLYAKNGFSEGDLQVSPSSCRCHLLLQRHSPGKGTQLLSHPLPWGTHHGQL